MIEPTPEDYEAAERDMARSAREVWLEISAKEHARKRVAREQAEAARIRRERRQQFLRRLIPFRRGS
jgi:hypothetical protein